MSEKNTYLLSDLHLGASYIDDPRKHELKIVEFLDSIKNDADAIYLVGDVLDYWYEYKHVVPRGFVRFFGKVAELADSGVKITWIIGNHDIWIFDYLPKELGIKVVDDNLIEDIHGHKCFISHGDGVGKLDPKFKFLRTLFRNRFCQKLYSGIHPRWTVAFAHRWSSHSRKGDEHRVEPEEKILKPLKDFSLEYLNLHPDIDYFIYGHIHVLAEEKLKNRTEMIVLGDWIKTFSYAKINSQGLELHKYKET